MPGLQLTKWGLDCEVIVSGVKSRGKQKGHEAVNFAGNIRIRISGI
jgi:hypothetical protein